MALSTTPALSQAASPRCLTLATDLSYNIMEVYGTPGNYTFRGPLKDIVHIIMNQLGYCYKLLPAADRTYGELHPNGSWSGLLGMVQRGEAAFTPTVVMATPPGMATFSYSEPLLLSEYNVMFARPGLMPSGDGFIWPFTQLLWVLLLVSCVIVFVATMFTLRGQAVMLRAAVDRGGGFGDSSDVEEMEMDGGTWWRSANRAFLWTWSVLMSQSVPWTPLGTAVRLVAGMWLLWIVVMGALYRSNLKAMLILPKVRLPFDSLEELAASGIPLGVPEDSMVEALLKESDSSSVLGRLRQNMRILGVENYEKHSADLFGGMLAVASYTSTLRRAIHSDFSFKGRCRTYLMSRGFFGPASLSMVFPRGSPLMAKVNKIIEQLREAGILDYLLNAAYFNGTECLKPITSFSLPSERPLELLDFYGMFALYLAGIVLALLVFLLEMTFDPTKRGKKMGGDGRAP